MTTIPVTYQQIFADITAHHAKLVAVSKTKSVEEIRVVYDLGQRDFGENYVQELVEKQGKLPADIRWHFIGHLQGNKAKMIAPFIHLVHSVDSMKLLAEINKQGKKTGRVIDCLLQVYIAREETKFGFDEAELAATMQAMSNPPMVNIRIRGLMGMASFTDDMMAVRKEFQLLKRIFDDYAKTSSPQRQFDTLSMGMSSDYQVAIEEGSTMVRIGSLIFGARP